MGLRMPVDIHTEAGMSAAPTHCDNDLSIKFSRRTALKALGATAAAGLLPGYGGFAAAQGPPPDPLDSLALGGSPAQAFASHKARANGIARHFALTRPLRDVNGEADENHTTTLLAHFHTVADDPGFTPPGEEPSATAAPAALRRLFMGDGLVGTRNDYDMALKGLMVLAYRYPHLLGEGGVDFILNTLVPVNISGGHPPELEIVEVTFLNIDIPETENHLLMIESSRYLINQLRLDRTGDIKFNNSRNGLSGWLLGYMQRIVKHDFLEFNSRPYQRHALHPLFNLHEFARDDEIRTASQMLLDYTMMKFAVSSNRGRRVSPSGVSSTGSATRQTSATTSIPRAATRLRATSWHIPARPIPRAIRRNSRRAWRSPR